MKATGIVRRIDDLGRVVVPKEIRRTLRIREGDPLEIFTDKEGEIILKKYSPMGELGTFAQQYVDAVAATLGKTVAICDRDQIIAAYGSLKKEILGLPLHKRLEEVIHNRTSICGKIGEKEFVPIVLGKEDLIKSELIQIIIAEGDAIGAILILDGENEEKMGEIEKKVAVIAANFLGHQMEL